MGLFDRISDEIEAKEKMAGLSPVDLLDMSRDLRNLVQALARRGESTLATIAEAIEQTPEETQKLLTALEEKGFVLEREIKGEMHYRTYFARRRRREVPLNLWDALEEKTTASEDGDEDASSTDAGQEDES